MQPNRPVLAPALEEAAIEGGAAGAVDVEIVVDDAGFQTRQSHDRLERRSGRLLGLNGAIQQRMSRDYPADLSNLWIGCGRQTDSDRRPDG